MPIFPKRRVDAPDPAPVGYSVLDAQMCVEGDLDTDGALRIDGRVHGNVRSGGTLVLAAGASITGTVWAREVIIGGTITGNVTATGRVELQQTGVVNGDIETSAIMIQEGGTVDGRMTVHPTTGAQADTRAAMAAD